MEKNMCWKQVAILMTALALASAAFAKELDAAKLPAELKPFVSKNYRAIFAGSEDLNGDGKDDYLLVIEKTSPPKSVLDDSLPSDRSLLIITRQPDGSLKQAVRNDRLVYCRECGGVMGDPFITVTLKKNRFTVNHYGGSNWRWTADYTFAWSRIDQAWQLVAYDSESFHTSDIENIKYEHCVPPRHFGKLDLASFDEGAFSKRLVKRTKGGKKMCR